MIHLPTRLPIRAPRPETAPRLAEAASEGRWFFVPALQGRVTDFSVAVGLHEGELAAIAHWTDPLDASTRRIWGGTGRDGIARVLTLAAVAVQGGQA